MYSVVYQLDGTEHASVFDTWGSAFRFYMDIKPTVEYVDLVEG
jgi:hypothetical protein